MMNGCYICILYSFFNFKCIVYCVLWATSIFNPSHSRQRAAADLQPVALLKSWVEKLSRRQETLWRQYGCVRRFPLQLPAAMLPAFFSVSVLPLLSLKCSFFFFFYISIFIFTNVSFLYCLYACSNIALI